MTEMALITGASSGIGWELAKIFASDGVGVVLVARREDRLEQLKDEIGSKWNVPISVIAVDLSVPGAPQALFDGVCGRNIEIAYLVNNAGFGDFGWFVHADVTAMGEMIDLNIKALTQTTRLFLPPMMKRGKGRIMNLASLAAFQPGPLMAVYFATKAYVLSFSEGISNELEGTGITVTALCPGPTESGFKTAAKMEDSGLFKKKRVPSSEEVARYGYASMMGGKTVAIHGIGNWILANSVRFAPRSMVTRIARSMTEKK